MRSPRRRFLLLSSRAWLRDRARPRPGRRPESDHRVGRGVGATARAYLDVLSVPDARPFFLATLAGRFGISMTGLGVLLLVHATFGSWAMAGLATGTFALAEALAGPQVARIVDRRGQGVVLPVLLALHLASMVSLILVALGPSATATLVVTAFLAGASLPTLGAMSATRWSQLLPDKGSLRTAFALEASANDIAFLVGPPSVIAIGALVSPVVG